MTVDLFRDFRKCSEALSILDRHAPSFAPYARFAKALRDLMKGEGRAHDVRALWEITKGELMGEVPLERRDLETMTKKIFTAPTEDVRKGAVNRQSGAPSPCKARE